MEGDPTEPQSLDASSSTPSGDCFGLVGHSLDGKYEVESVVAEGGFGVVYRATHRTLHKHVAIKVLKVPPDLSGATRSEFLAKFAQEARTVGAMDHAAIVRVLDFGACPMPQGEAAPWMALEWLTGTTLEADLTGRKGTPRSPTEVMALMRPVLEGMAMAHEEGVVHRDIKPANLMLVADRKGGVRLKILDFGIAKLMGGEERSSSGHTATRSTLHAFSLHAAAPEQISGTRTGPWTDVHALALVITEMLTGCEPYSGADVTELYAAVLGSQRPTPAKMGFDVGVWEPVLARALSLKPGERYPDARTLCEALCGEVPSAFQREGVSPPSGARSSGDSPVITTLRPASKLTGATATSVRTVTLGIVAAVVFCGVLVGGVAYRIGMAATSRASAAAPIPRSSTQPQRATEGLSLPLPIEAMVVPDAGVRQGQATAPTRDNTVGRRVTTSRPSATHGRPALAAPVHHMAPESPLSGPQNQSEVPVE